MRRLPAVVMSARKAGSWTARAGLAVACAIAAVLIFGRSTRPAGANAEAANQRYGSLPAYLPKTTTPVGVVVTASAARPQTAIEGDTVDVVTATGSVQVTVVGPVVPEEGKFPVPAMSPCTFTVTVAAPHGTVVLTPRSMFALDERGDIHTLAVPRGTNAPPAVVPAQGETFELTAVLPTGSGALTWAPTGKALVSWDFDVEID